MVKKVLKEIIKLAGKQKEIAELDLLDIIDEAELDDVEKENIYQILKEKKIKIKLEEDEDYEPDEELLEDLEFEDVEGALFQDDKDEEEAIDPVRMYLKDIGKIDLLKVDEERKLGEKIFRGKEASQKLELKEKGELKISKNQIKKYENQIEEGHNAARKLTEANFRLVVAVAKKYEKSTSSMSFLDLIQEGNLGLMRAVEKYDYRKGFKFSTYATWWIKQGVTRSIAEKSRTIRIPVHMNETINKMNKAKRYLIQKLGREPNEEEIVDRVNEVDPKQKLTVEKMQYIRSISPNPLSLETPVGEEEDSSFGDLISDQKTANPHQNMIDEKIMEVLSESLRKNLTDREEKVLRMRTGLYDGHEYTLEEVGAEFNVTRERIRQIENKAKAKLRKPDQKRLFQSVLKKKNDF